MEDKNKKGFFREWLETLQQESWQLELLISGLALLGIFSAKTYLDDISTFIDVQFLSRRISVVLNLFLFILKGSWFIFIVNLIIHIILRGLWIGAVGLRYVSEDIDWIKLNFSPYFEKLYFRRYKSFDDYIADLERICSVIFAYTFLLFFLFLSSILFLLWPILLVSYIDQDIGGLIVFGYVLLGVIVFIDFICLNPLKRVRGLWFGRIYGAIFRFYSTITLSFLFRPILLNFLDNKFTRKLFLFSIPYSIIIILILPRVLAESHGYFPNLGQRQIEFRSYNAESINPELYDNLRSKTDKAKIEYLSLESDVIRSNYLYFFFAMRPHDEDYLKNVRGIEKLHKEGVYTSFRKIRGKNKELDSLKSLQSQKVIEIINLKASQPDLYSDQEWVEMRENQSFENDRELKEFYKKQLKRITAAIFDYSAVYIDDEDVTSKLACYFSEHENMGEKGWKCYLPLDSIPQGAHKFRVDRGDYDQRNKTTSSFELEIPFILDSK